jgi:hypothetical protein
MGSVTILTSANRMLATKGIRLGPTGEIKITGYGNGRKFLFRQHAISGIDQLSRLLTELEREKYSFVIRGEPIPGLDPARAVRRLSRQSDGDGPYFRSTEGGQDWLCLDFDKVPCPSDLQPNDEPERAIRYLISLLPSEFDGVTCHWQWSSRAGLYGWSVLKAHLWFMLDQRRGDEQLRAWAKTTGGLIDPAPFNTVQPHYTANPIFEGMADPVTRRSGLLAGIKDRVSLELREPAN